MIQPLGHRLSAQGCDVFYPVSKLKQNKQKLTKNDTINSILILQGF